MGIDWLVCELGSVCGGVFFFFFFPFWITMGRITKDCQAMPLFALFEEYGQRDLSPVNSLNCDNKKRRTRATSIV